MLGQFKHPALFIAHPSLLLLSLAFPTCDHQKRHYSGQSWGDKLATVLFLKLYLSDSDALLSTLGG